VLELSKVTKVYGDVPVVWDVDLFIPAGQITIIIGPSGCGKSTLIRIMNGLVPADRGSVCFIGAPVTPATALSLRLRMGYMIQDGGLFPHLTARRNVILMACELGWSPARINARVMQLTELTRFPLDALDRYPAQLSGGQRQRVALQSLRQSSDKTMIARIALLTVVAIGAVRVSQAGEPSLVTVGSEVKLPR
jgi:osmoprotectant transport system ATP-binding protein